MRLRTMLTVSEVGLALVLLVGAGLLFRSFVKLLTVDTGFERKNAIVALVQLPAGRYPDSTRRMAAFDEIIARVRAMPNVSSVGITTDLPISSSWQMTISREGAVAGDADAEPLMIAATVSPGYFGTLRVASRSGRDFAISDRLNQPLVTIVSAAAALRLFGNVDAVGKRLKVGGVGANSPWITVVGVVDDVRNVGLQRKSPGTVYLPTGQRDLTSAWFVVRTDASIDVVGPALRKLVASFDPELPISQLQTLERSVDSTIAQPKFSLVMLAIFASIAFALAAVGVYGVISYSVAQRTREIGVRIALGAQRGDVLRMVVREGMSLSAIGVIAGGIGAALSGKLIAKHLFDVGPSDPIVFAGVAVMVLAMAFAASVVPALRATHIDPVEAMRRD